MTSVRTTNSTLKKTDESRNTMIDHQVQSICQHLRQLCDCCGFSVMQCLRLHSTRLTLLEKAKLAREISDGKK
ncbi:hypothetical protein MTR_1g034110 [Medicago truncatula]|uniref:Uncharacterized protein n=1 Tax=Medicago truncatula TaxID=3880 RepID=A0A072VGM1_MEDTR|nr:hypothetical protein MTR_1g034110 [Medicago truncatula]